MVLYTLTWGSKVKLVLDENVDIVWRSVVPRPPLEDSPGVVESYFFLLTAIALDPTDFFLTPADAILLLTQH